MPRLVPYGRGFDFPISVIEPLLNLKVLPARETLCARAAIWAGEHKKRIV